jgi:hypothetical protein
MSELLRQPAPANLLQLKCAAAYQALAPHRLVSADPPNSAEDLCQLRLERQSVCVTGDQLGKSEGTSGHIILGSADPTHNGLCDKCEKRSTACSWDLFCMGSTALKTEMDRCKTRPSLLRPSGSDMHGVKESIYIC